MAGLILHRRRAGLLAAALLLAGSATALAQGPAMPGIGGDLIPHDLSPWRMFLSADSVVKGVLVGLALASVVTWTVWLAKSIELRRAQGAAARVLGAVEQARRLAVEPAALGGDGKALVDAALAEIALSGGELAQPGLQDRIASRLQRLEAAAGRRMMRGTGVLATIGSVGPFVGLFGTVWGIMNSFIGISQSQTTNLAVVAPGIAEALLATAVGLVAAIPAVVIYNLFARAIGGYRARLADISAALLRTVSREMDRPASSPGLILRSAAE